MPFQRQGLRFYPRSLTVERGEGAPILVHDEIESGRSDFDYIFRPVFRLLDGLVFVEDLREPTLQQVDDPSYERAVWLRRRSWQLVRAEVLESFGLFIVDDWEQLLFFDRPDEALIGRADELLRTNSLRGLVGPAMESPSLQVLIHSTRPGIYDALLARHAGDARLGVFRVDRREEYPEPSNGELEPAC